jgi:serine protease Do
LEESNQEGGIKRGDIIIQFDGKPVSSTRYLRQMVTNAEIGRVISLKVFRDGKEKMLEIRVGKLVS